LKIKKTGGIYAMKRFLLIAAALCLLSGCAQSEKAETKAPEAQTEASSEQEAAAEAQNGSAADMGTSVSQAGDEAAFPLTFTDDLGREVVLQKKPERTAALIGSFADIWCLAGGKETLVAAADDSFTSFDLGLSDQVVRLGAIKSPSLEKLLEAEPDFILASSKNTADMEMLETFEQAGIPAAYFDVSSFDDYRRMLSICTEATGKPELNDRYGTQVEKQIEAAVARKKEPSPTVLYIRATGKGCSVKNSKGSVLGEMLADLGCTNVADKNESLLENLSLEAIMESDPDYIFLILQGSDSTDAQKSFEDALLSNPAWNTLRAVTEGRFYQLEHSLYNLKPNERWGEAYEKLADILYPDTEK